MCIYRSVEVGMICSVELPIKYLESFSQYFDYDFVIASNCLSYPKYFDYYKHSGRRMILDNGAFETGEAINDKLYYGVVKELKPDIIVLPDAYNDEVKTVMRSLSFLRFWEKNAIPGIELMVVLPGNSEERILSEYVIFQKASPKVIWYGLPYGSMINRYQFLKKHPEITNIHILGLSNLGEACALSELHNIVSIDTSLPIRCTTNKLYMSKVLSANDHVSMLEENLDENLLVYNLNTFRGVCHNNFRIVQE